MNAILLACCLQPALDQRVEVDLARADSLASYRNVKFNESGLALSPQPGKWLELFRGRAGFGLVTGVYWMRDRLFFLDSPLPAGSDGGDVYVWEQGRAKKLLEVKEQGVSYIRGADGKLFIPGADATEAWDFGNVYRSLDAGTTWTKLRTVPKAVHIWDLAHWREKMYVSTGSVKDKEGYGAVLESSDDGKTWKEILVAYPPSRKTQFARCYALIPLRDALYASFAVVDNDPKKPGPRPEHDFYRFDGRTWTPVKLFQEPQRSPYFGFRHRDFQKFALLGTASGGHLLIGDRVAPIDGLQGLVVFDFDRIGKEEVLAIATDPKTKTSAVYVCPHDELVEGTGRFEKAYDLPQGQEGLTVRSILGRVYVGTKAAGGGRLLTEGNHTQGEAITLPIRINNEGKVTLRWVGDQPSGCRIVFQVHTARSESDLARIPWSALREGTSPPSFEVTGVPRGPVFIQVRAVLVGTDITGPTLRTIRIETTR